ncbi:hypothetical protein [Gimesia panareensis]|uniref:hypothetical protein n=1 Tax=Gimesia panareensis TaxID=2527978 RepID=UPI00118B232E|nr:hypothetical protein [Gimesia panareensis]QDU50443.1 hypothetical protein Pan110_27890 [Gimesia panareensis]
MNVSQPVRFYRLRPFYLYLGIASVSLFSLAGIGAALAAFYNLDGSFRYPVFSAFLFGGFFLGCSLLGLWCILSYYRERLEISGFRLIKHDVFRTTEIPFDEVTHLQWFSLTGAIVVESPFKKFKFHIDNYSKAEQVEITNRLRHSLDHDMQEGWEKFQKFNPAIFQPADQSPRPESFVFVGFLLIFAGMFGYAWWSGRGVHFLFIGLINFAVALWWFSDFRKKTGKLKTKQPGKETAA